MQINGSYEFQAPIERVWELLMDTTAIAACLPGCQELRGLGDDRYEAQLVVAFAAITGNYRATVAIEEQAPPRSYRLVVHGTGRPGFVNGRAAVTLEPSSAGTSVKVEADAEVGGLIARVGQRLLEGVAGTMMNKFFECLASRLHERGESSRS